MKYYSKVLFSLNKYIGSHCKSVDDAEFVFETESVGIINDFNDGRYELNLYHKGELADYCINGWSFSYNAKGGFHVPGSYEKMDLKVEACAPNGEIGNFLLSLGNTSAYFIEAAPLYMNIVMVVSLCDSINDAHILHKAFKEGLNSYNPKDSLDNLKTIEKILKEAKYNNEIPEKWIQHADAKYKLMYEKFVEQISKEDLLKLLLE